MRLTQEEVVAIKETAAKWFGTDAEVRLFGSRARTGSTGGDIDLHVLTNASERSKIQTEIAFNIELQERIGEQKIDVVVRCRDSPPHAIDFIAFDTGTLL